MERNIFDMLMTLSLNLMMLKAGNCTGGTSRTSNIGSKTKTLANTVKDSTNMKSYDKIDKNIKIISTQKSSH